MILPIYAYGNPVLKRKAEPITADYPELQKLIDDMWETMYNASGVGLAAPQIGLGIRLFLVDSTMLHPEEERENNGIKHVMINAEILDEGGDDWGFEEGCLSIPEIRGEVFRAEQVKIKWQDENFETHEAIFEGVDARVIQHEYDHIEGNLFTEYLGPIKKRLVQRKLDKIRKGQINPEYRMKFYQG